MLGGRVHAADGPGQHHHIPHLYWYSDQLFRHGPVRVASPPVSAAAHVRPWRLAAPVGAVLSCWTALALAANITVLGLFPNMAVLRVDGSQHVLHVGDSTPGGIKLIRADSEAAILEINGKRQRFTLGTQISTRFKSPKQATAQIWADTNGMYLTQGAINGNPMDFVVDTGATWVSMNEHQARRLGIDFRYQGKPAAVSTANGVVRVYRVTLDTVKVGDITLHNVTAVVHPGSSPPTTLLGMSFLGRLDMSHKGNMLELRTKY